MTKLADLADLGQSIWLDFIRRSFIESGELQRWIDDGLRGVTSNPSIFEKAIAGSTDYDHQLQQLVAEDLQPSEIYEALVLDDIAHAADLLRPVYDRTGGLDGYVSLEANPALAYDAAGTVDEIRRFHAHLRRPNILFKVPATPEGIPAIQSLIALGISVNVTLIFSLDQYRAVAEAYVAGLERFAVQGGDLATIASVASFFVSRVDASVDQALDQAGNQDLKGQIAVANAKVASVLADRIFSGPRWERLAARGARVQRLLWASTSTKNPLYPDTMYVDSLIGPDTVNTVPPSTLQAYLDHGQVALTLVEGRDKAQRQLNRLSELGIDLSQITQTLLDKGVAAFAKAFDDLMKSIEEKQQQLLHKWAKLSTALGSYEQAVQEGLEELEANRTVERIWAHDHTVWKPEPDEITNRLGWLHIAHKMIENLDCLEALADDVLTAGYTHVLLLGMGGSSLAPEVFQKVFGGQSPRGLELSVLDSTDPAAVRSFADTLDPAHTLLIVATKSGRTAETLAFFKFFYTWAAEALGQQNAGEHFIAITDPGSDLAAIAQDYDFRATFLNDPHIGGRYSALSYFGLVPAALVGVDLDKLLNRALTLACNCWEPHYAQHGGNSSALLGAVLGELATAGRDKLTLFSSPAVASFGDWVEQLVAESTGKEGKGILPVVGEPLGALSSYGDDRLFVYLRLDSDPDADLDAALPQFAQAGHPVVWIHLRDLYDLGEQFFLWEMATAIASARLGINPFDQPNVESAKKSAREMIAKFQATGRLPTVLSSTPSLAALDGLVSGVDSDSYIALQAYLAPNDETDAALRRLRVLLRDRCKLTTTVGYGPRFLHSTGQLHKGDAGKGVFVQLTTDDPRDVPIPDQAGASQSSMSFAVLKAAQALGDRQALVEAQRQVIRFHLPGDPAQSLARLTRELEPR